MTIPVVKMIWAEGLNHAIGKDNKIPWRLKEDMEFFQDMTRGCTVIMGKNTWLSLPATRRPLAKRTNLILTSSPDSFEHEGAECFPSMDDALASLEEDEIVWVMGGRQVYEAGFCFTNDIFVTEVDMEVEGADTFAPVIPDDFRLEASTDWEVSDNGIRYRFTRYGRTKHFVDEN